MGLKVKEKFISTDMTTDAELAVETQARTNQDIIHTNRLNALRARVRQTAVSTPIENPGGTTWTVIGTKFEWVHSRNNSYVNPVLCFLVTIANQNRLLDLRVVNSMTGEVLGSMLNISNNGRYILTFNRPSTDASIEIQTRQTQGGASPVVEHAFFEFDTITGQ